MAKSIRIFSRYPAPVFCLGLIGHGMVIGHEKCWERVHRERLTREQFMSLTDVVQHVFIVRLLKYEDVMGGKHEVGFCWMSQPQGHNHGVQFTIYPSRLNYNK